MNEQQFMKWVLEVSKQEGYNAQLFMKMVRA